MKVSRNKKNMYSVMGHARYGGVTIVQEGVVMEVPEAQIRKNGKYRVRVNEIMDAAKTIAGLTVEDAMKLAKVGVIIHK